MSKVLYIVRGLPGSGKSTIASKLAPADCIFEADQYFVDAEGNYNFDGSKIRNAHWDCKERVFAALDCHEPAIVVSNTFTQKWEVEPYIKQAKKDGYEIQLITVQSNFQNVHGVPQESIERMKKRWENFTLEDFQ